MAKTTKKTTAKTGEPAATAKKKTTTKKAATKKATVKKAAAKATTSKKTTEKKTVAKKVTTQKATPKAAPKKKTTTKAALRSITAEERRQMIAEAAYLRGESQGFLSDEKEDWILAEAEVNALLAKAKVIVGD
jgi:hypothetical protein